MNEEYSRNLSDYHTAVETPFYHSLGMKESFELLPGTYDESVSNQFPVIPKYSVYMNLLNRLLKSGIVSSYGLYKSATPITSKYGVGKYSTFVFPDSSLSSSQKDMINNIILSPELDSNRTNGKLYGSAIWLPHTIVPEDYINPRYALMNILNGKIYNRQASHSLNDTLIKGKQVLSNAYINNDSTITRNITGTYYEDDYMFLIEIDGPLVKL
jgi:hypothetical protein